MLVLPGGWRRGGGESGKFHTERKAAPDFLGLASHGSISHLELGPSQVRGPWQYGRMSYSLHTGGPVAPSQAESISLNDLTHWVQDLKAGLPQGS